MQFQPDRDDSNPMEQSSFKRVSFRGCLWICSKFLIFAVIRGILFKINWNPTEYQIDEIFNFILVWVYLFIMFFGGCFLERLNQSLILIGVVIQFVIEILLVILSEYSHLIMILFLSISLNVFLLGFFQKQIKNFNLLMAILMHLLFVFVFMLITLIFFREDTQQLQNSTGILNAFLGLEIYVFWLTLFQFDLRKLDFLSGLKIFFGIGYDMSIVVIQILKEIGIEWDEDKISNAEALNN